MTTGVRVVFGDLRGARPHLPLREFLTGLPTLTLKLGEIQRRNVPFAFNSWSLEIVGVWVDGERTPKVED